MINQVCLSIFVGDPLLVYSPPLLLPLCLLTVVLLYIPIKIAHNKAPAIMMVCDIG